MNIATPIPAEQQRMIDHAFHGNLGRHDILHMARELLKLADEMHELRERIRVLERSAGREADGMRR